MSPVQAVLLGWQAEAFPGGNTHPIHMGVVPPKGLGMYQLQRTMGCSHSVLTPHTCGNR